MRDSVRVAPSGAENTLGTFTRDIYVSGEVIANFLDRRFLDVNGGQTERTERLDVEAL